MLCCVLWLAGLPDDGDSEGNCWSCIEVVYILFKENVFCGNHFNFLWPRTFYRPLSKVLSGMGIGVGDHPDLSLLMKS